MKIGDTVWVFDQNHRVYEEGASGPVWIKHWVERRIVDETSRSWVLKNHLRVNKENHGSGVAFSWREVEDHRWVNDNQYKILRRLNTMHDYDTLKAIAKMIGYKEG